MPSESLKDCFVDRFSAQPEKKAITFLREGVVETEISYGELDQDSNRMAALLLDLGIKKGDRAVLYLPKSIGFVVAYLALQKMGAIAVPLNDRFKRPEMAYLLEDAGANLVLSGSGQETLIREIAPGLKTLVIETERPYQDLSFFQSVPPDPVTGVDIEGDSPGLIIYTSGTTGLPKGAVLTQQNLLHDTRNVIKTWEITDADVLCHALPLFHIHGLCFALHTALMAGAHILMLDAFSPERAMEALSKREGKIVCTLFMGVPSMYGKMLEHAGEEASDYGHMRLWTSGSAPLLPRDFERIKRTFGQEPVEREGMSETGMNFSNPLKGKRKPGSVGLPLPGLQVRLVDPRTLEDVAPGQTGEIWLKGPGITPGYWQKPEETAKAFVDGWFRTGDLGNVDHAGYTYLTDRMKHIIISGGENISPKEVEMVINRFEGVVESSVVGIPDEKWGEMVVAAVVLKPSSKVTPREIKDFCRENLHDWKCPRSILFLGELPKNRMGKILKEKVKKHFLRERGSGMDGKE